MSNAQINKVLQDIVKRITERYEPEIIGGNNGTLV